MSGPPCTMRCPTATGGRDRHSRSHSAMTCWAASRSATASSRRDSSSLPESSLTRKAGCSAPMPDTWPPKRIANRCASLTSYTWNFRLELPAFTTRMTSCMRDSPCGLDLAPRQIVGIHGCDGAGCELGIQTVGPAGQDDGYAGAQHNARCRSAAEKGQILGQHVACFQIRHHQDLRPARHFGIDSLDARRFRTDGVVQRQWAIKHAPDYLPA